MTDKPGLVKRHKAFVVNTSAEFYSGADLFISFIIDGSQRKRDNFARSTESFKLIFRREWKTTHLVLCRVNDPAAAESMVSRRQWWKRQIVRQDADGV